MRKYIRKWMNNSPLGQKLLAIVLIGVFTMTAVSFLVVQVLSGSYNKLLYQTLSESLGYSSDEIEKYMQKMEFLTSVFLSEERVQENLALIRERDGKSAASMSAVYNLRSYIGECYQSYSDGILKYITLYMPDSAVYTNVLAADKTPGEVQEQMVSAAEAGEGAPIWVTDHMEDYGLFLVRTIRQIETLKLDHLGTILLNVDMDELVRSSTRLEEQYGESAYVILDGDQILYHTDNLSGESAGQMQAEQIERYDVVELDGGSYFAVHGSIGAYGWDYYCLISYDVIARQLVGIKAVCLLIMALDLLVVIFLCARLVGRLMAHVNRLTEKMRQFARDNTRVPQVNYDYSDRGDELGMLNRQFDDMSETIIRLIQENYVNELLKKEAQIKALENQINPHFLYNTLDSIKWRAKAIREKDISDMVEALAALLRTSLSRKDEKDYSLGKEIEVIRSYITIQKLRYEERLEFENRIPEKYYGLRIPKLVIQPLVENAIYYGVEANVEDCSILLDAQEKDGALHIFVRNTGSEMEDGLLSKIEQEEIIPHGNGVGLVNIEKRIKLCYGEAYGLHFYNEEDYAVAELFIPLRQGEELC